MSRDQNRWLALLVSGLSVTCLLLAACQQHSKSLPASTSETEDLLQWVNPLIGTDGKGKTYPGATVPYGMLQLSPDNGRSGWDWISGYFYPDTQIAGFSHLHLSGTGAGDLYDISFLPFSGDFFQTLPAAGGKETQVRTERFSHSNEKASPGYYRVLLEDSQIEVELTAALRSGLQRYRYLQSDAPALLQLDLTYSRNWDSTTATCLYQPDAYTLAGYRFSSGWAKDQKVFFYSKSSVPLKAVRNLPTALPTDLSQCAQAGPTLFQLQLDASAGNEVLLRTALSSVSVAGAAANLAADLATQTTPAVAPDQQTDQQTGNFATTLAQAQSAWRVELSQVQINADAQTQTQFYTALYHSALAPRVYSDADGQYRGPDGQIHQLQRGHRMQRTQITQAGQALSSNQHYDFFSLWDTFRAQHPWKTLFDTPRHQAMMYSLLEHYQSAGRLPVWNFQGVETDMMLGYHAVPVLVDSYLKGLLPDPDGQLGAMILQAALESANDEQNNEKFGIQSYRQLGYVPFSERPWNVALTLEYAFDDSAIARLAHRLGKADIAAEFDRRAQNYRQHFDAASGFMRAKDQQGQFRLPFDPEAYHPEDYCEANAWQYSFFVPHDVAGLINLHGGQQAFVAKLDAMFLTGQQKKGPATPEHSAATPVHSTGALSDNHGLPEWISGFIGQYVHGNEPSHHVPYLYALAGRPDKTQALVRQIMRTLYQPVPDGLAGNEDAGQMSAWYLFSALGFYPVDPVSGDYVLGSPLVRQATLRLGNGKVLKIIANNQSEQHPYVKAVRLNGRAVTGPLLSHQALLAGGVLEFDMSASPAPTGGF